MIERYECGMIFSGDDVCSPIGRLVGDLWDDYCDALREIEFWRKAALGEFWEEAKKSIESDNPF